MGGGKGEEERGLGEGKGCKRYVGLVIASKTKTESMATDTDKHSSKEEEERKRRTSRTLTFFTKIGRFGSFSFFSGPPFLTTTHRPLLLLVFFSSCMGVGGRQGAPTFPLNVMYTLTLSRDLKIQHHTASGFLLLAVQPKKHHANHTPFR